MSNDFPESVARDADLAWLVLNLPTGIFNTLSKVTLAALRDTLLSKMLSGEVRVKNVRRLSEEALA